MTSSELTESLEMRCWINVARTATSRLTRAVSARNAWQRSAISTSSTNDDHEDFYRYTSGRWLWDEESRLRERYRRFNAAALQDIATMTVNAKHCMSMEKIAEGGSNKIFRLSLDTGKSVIARIPHRRTEWSPLSMASEVATMDFAARVLHIPVPQVLAWDADADNTVQSEYIIMEEAPGVQLGSLWKDLSIKGKHRVVKQLASISAKLLSVSFTLHGNLYLTASNIPGCQPAIAAGTIPSHIRTMIANDYTIGPVVEESYWVDGRADIANVRGPWIGAKAWLKALGLRERRWLREYASLDTPREDDASSQGDPSKHISLYNKFLAASDHLIPDDAKLLRPTLWHWDLHAPNIFVKDGNITSIIDWQDCCIAPLMFQARRPSLVHLRGEMMLDFPDYYSSMDEGSEKQQIADRVEESILQFFYDRDLRSLDPICDRIRELPQATNIKDLVSFAANTWNNGILPFRECLIRALRHWGEICPEEPCPFQFSDEELSIHAVEGEGYNENADFWSSISGLVARDGFVLKEDYNEAFELFASMREEGLCTLEGQERDDFDKATSWAMRTPEPTK